MSFDSVIDKLKGLFGLDKQESNSFKQRRRMREKQGARMDVPSYRAPLVEKQNEPALVVEPKLVIAQGDDIVILQEQLLQALADGAFLFLNFGGAHSLEDCQECMNRLMSLAKSHGGSVYTLNRGTYLLSLHSEWVSLWVNGREAD